MIFVVWMWRRNPVWINYDEFVGEIRDVEAAKVFVCKKYVIMEFRAKNRGEEKKWKLRKLTRGHHRVWKFARTFTNASWKRNRNFAGTKLVYFVFSCWYARIKGSYGDSNWLAGRLIELHTFFTYILVFFASFRAYLLNILIFFFYHLANVAWGENYVAFWRLPL